MSAPGTLPIRDPALQMIGHWLNRAEEVLEREFQTSLHKPPRLAERQQRGFNAVGHRLALAWKMVQSIQLGLNDNVPGFRTLTNIGSHNLPLRRPMDLLRKWALEQAEKHRPRTRARVHRFRSRPRARHHYFWAQLAALAAATDHCAWLEWAVVDDYARAS